MRFRRIGTLVLLVVAAAAMTPTPGHAAIGFGLDGDGPTLIERIGQVLDWAEGLLDGFVSQFTQKEGAGIASGG